MITTTCCSYSMIMIIPVMSIFRNVCFITPQRTTTCHWEFFTLYIVSLSMSSFTCYYCIKNLLMIMIAIVSMIMTSTIIKFCTISISLFTEKSTINVISIIGPTYLRRMSSYISVRSIIFRSIHT